MPLQKFERSDVKLSQERLSDSMNETHGACLMGNSASGRTARIHDPNLDGVSSPILNGSTARDFGNHTGNGLTFIDLFAGIGGIRLGLERAGCICKFSSEWDEEAAQTYEAYFHERPAGDITKVDSSQIPDHDILAGGFPCQAFSIMGDMKGFGDTRGTLFFEIERILRDKSPRAFLLENVRNLVSHDRGRTFKVILGRLRDLGYSVHWKILNALDFNLPQKRERVIIVGSKCGVSRGCSD